MRLSFGMTAKKRLRSPLRKTNLASHERRRLVFPVIILCKLKKSPILAGFCLFVKTADLCDQYVEKLQVCQLPLHTYGGKKQFSGPIATVDVLEDNVLVREALETVPTGTVLVVDGKGSRNCALLGDRLAQIACERGLAGGIIHGCIRDSAEIATMPLGVLALGSQALMSMPIATAS